MRFSVILALVASASAIRIAEEPAPPTPVDTTPVNPIGLDAAAKGKQSAENKFGKCKYFKASENSGCELEADQLPCTKARTDSNHLFNVVKVGDKLECQR